MAWTRLLAVAGQAGVLAGCEPKALRYRLLQVPARLAHGGRRRRIRLPSTWPWAVAIVAVFAIIAAIPRRPAARRRQPALHHAHTPDQDEICDHALANLITTTS